MTLCDWHCSFMSLPLILCHCHWYCVIFVIIDQMHKLQPKIYSFFFVLIRLTSPVSKIQKKCSFRMRLVGLISTMTTDDTFGQHLCRSVHCVIVLDTVYNCHWYCLIVIDIVSLSWIFHYCHLYCLIVIDIVSLSLIFCHCHWYCVIVIDYLIR